MNLLKLYHESLSKTIKILGSDPDKLFTFENFQDELQICGNYALLLAPIVIAVSTDAISGLDDTSNSTTNEAFERNSSQMKIQSQLKFQERINGLLEDICNLGYYQKMNL